MPLISEDCGNAEWFIDRVDCLKARRSADGFAARIAEVSHSRSELAAVGRRAQATVLRDFRIDAAVPGAERTLARAACERRPARGTAADFSRLARFADDLAATLLAERATA